MTDSAPQGHTHDVTPAISLKVSEVFDSLQGEGPTAGQACTFLRLAGCNLACTWCDTEYSWNWARYDVASQVTRQSVAHLVARFRDSQRLVITGGEPLLQQKKLQLLLDRLPEALPVEVETNGTIVPERALQRRVDQWNVSPKLSNSGEPEARRHVPAALTALRDMGQAWLKLVVAGPADAEEAMRLVQESNWPRERVQFMPLAADREQLQHRLPVVQQLAQQHGTRLSPRLHVELWDGQRGV